VVKLARIRKCILDSAVRRLLMLTGWLKLKEWTATEWIKSHDEWKIVDILHSYYRFSFWPMKYMYFVVQPVWLCV